MVGKPVTSIRLATCYPGGGLPTGALGDCGPEHRAASERSALRLVCDGREDALQHFVRLGQPARNDNRMPLRKKTTVASSGVMTISEHRHPRFHVKPVPV
jgi:hypothetical protein